MTEKIDFGKTVDDYTSFRAGFPDRFFASLKERGVVGLGVKALDLGTGTGTVARGLARIGAIVTASDISESMIIGAKKLNGTSGTEIEYICSPAESTPFPSSSFDVVTCGQCWHWFDRNKAAKECHRLLRAEGKIVIAHFDWIPINQNVVQFTEQLIIKHNPNWLMGGGSGIYPVWFADLTCAGFKHLECYTFDIDVEYSHEAWRGRIRASAGVAAALEASKVSLFDQDLKQMLKANFPADPLLIPHRVFTLIGTK